MTSKRLLIDTGAATLSPVVTGYIIRHRDRLGPSSFALSETVKRGLRGYFSEVELDRVRIHVADPLPISEPPFAGIVRRLGFDFPSVALTAAITFDHVIACREQMTPSLLFHELVHVVQYRLLSIPAFAKHYVHGFLAGRSYHDIPLECCAFELEGRFVTVKDGFDVEGEVAAWIRERRF